jgi:hypothetical protein
MFSVLPLVELMEQLAPDMGAYLNQYNDTPHKTALTNLYLDGLMTPEIVEKRVVTGIFEGYELPLITKFFPAIVTKHEDFIKSKISITVCTKSISDKVD